MSNLLLDVLKSKEALCPVLGTRVTQMVRMLRLRSAQVLRLGGLKAAAWMSMKAGITSAKELLLELHIGFFQIQ